MRHFFSAILMLWVIGGFVIGGFALYGQFNAIRFATEGISVAGFAMMNMFLLADALLIWLGGAVLFGTLAIVSAVRPNY